MSQKDRLSRGLGVVPRPQTPRKPMSISSSSRGFDRFVHGSTLWHVITTTVTSALGLMAIFGVEFLSLFFLGFLEDPEVTAAIGYSGPIIFFAISLSLGFAIAGAVLVSRHVGAEGRGEGILGSSGEGLAQAKRITTTALGLSVLVCGFLGIGVFCWQREILLAMGAPEAVLDKASAYLSPVMLGAFAFGGSVTSTLVLRAMGDIHRSMIVTLIVAGVNGVLDPILIFGLDLGVAGAGFSVFLAHFSALCAGCFFLRRHGFLVPLSWEPLKRGLGPLFAISTPVIITQLAAPFAQFYLAQTSSQFGTEAVAAVAILNRLTPVAFALIFALSGAVGPIVGQNFGAGLFDRVRKTLFDSLLFSVLYLIVVSLFLFVFRHGIADLFHAKDHTRELVVFYCTFLPPFFLFSAFLFVAQAVFNTLGKPLWSTGLNWANALGNIPCLLVGAHVGGVYGMLVGSVLSPIPCGVVSLLLAYRLMRVGAR